MTARAYASTRYSVLSLHPAAPDRSATEWMAWDDWSKKMGLLNKHGEPSRSKVMLLIRHHCLSATKSKCIRTFHGIHPVTGKKIYRRISRIVVTPRCSDQLEWGPNEWQELHYGLFCRSQSGKAKHKRRNR